MSFVHLHNHTHYSLLDGLTKIDELVERAKNQGAPAVAITDHGVMYGAIEFYQKCQKEGIKPIIGVETYLAPESRFNKRSKEDAKNYHLLLLAKNHTGYKNLIKLVSQAHLEGFYYKPRIDWELLKKHHEGIIASTACLGGEIPQLILGDKLDKAKERILEYNELFGQDNFYLELMDHPSLEGQDTINNQLIKFSKELNVPVVATNDIHYLKPEDDEAQDILLCLQNKKKRDDDDRMKMLGENYSMKTPEEMEEAFSHVPEAIENTVKIAEKCNLELKLGETQLPHFTVPDNYTDDEYFRKLCEDGLKKRYGQSYEEVSQEIKERMDYELSVISKMGWPSYFLIVADFVSWAKEQGIVVGPGRGSAAGSLVCYLTDITNLDPLTYDLLFERFLNPERVSMPDIDLDFADERRDEVIKYVEDKYGQDKVAQIITFGTMAARAAIRDVGRVLNASYDYCDKIAKSIPMFSTIQEALDKVEEFKNLYNTDSEAKQIIDYAMRLEGVSRHASTHACGVLITKNPLTEHTPLQYASSSDKTIVSQYSLHPVEDLGLLKMDFLGLKNLTIIEAALKIIKKTRGKEIDIDKIPLDDERTYRLFQEGETTGVFQFESSGMKRYLRELKPSEFEDIIAMVALYRPGPMEWIPDYIAGKHKKKKISYLHPKLEGILNKTYGVAIYQEQVMQMARNLAGFSMGEADVLRKAMGKKIPELLAKQKEKFINGCIENNIEESLAKQIFSFIEPFAGYGFNRSHAACYALIGYQTAYLKAHWPVEFMAALLTADQNNTDRIAVEIEECKNMGINIMPPDINESFGDFTVVTSGTKENKVVEENETLDTIRFGLNAIKNVGEHIVDVIIQERKENGPYKDISDFLSRILDKDLNKKSLESLIKCGGLDNYAKRSDLYNNVETLLNYNKEVAKLQESKQSSLFTGDKKWEENNNIKLAPGPELKKEDTLAWEKELLGLYISEHPFEGFKKYLKEIVVPLESLEEYKNKEDIKIAGVVSSVKKIITRNNKAMLFAKIEDNITNSEVLVFPTLLEKNPEIWQEGKTVIMQGKISDKDQEIKVLADKAVELTLDNVADKLNEFSQIKVNKRKNNWKGNNNYGKNMNNNNNNSSPEEPAVKKPVKDPLKLIFKENLNTSALEELKKLLKTYPGDNEVYIKINNGDGSDNIVKAELTVDKTPQLISKIKNNFSEHIKVVDL